MFVKPAGNAYLVSRGVNETQGFLKGECLSDRRDSWTAESKTCITHTKNTHTHSPPVNSLCVCAFAGGGDKRESKVGHGHVYLKLLFPLQVPVP